MGWGGGAAGGRAAAAISSRISSKPPTRQPLPGGAPAVGAGVGQDGEWHRGPHPANPRARMRPPNPGRSGRREWASGKERRAARSPGSPASLRHRSRVFPQFEGIPCPSGAPREWPHPGIRPSPLVLSGPLFQSVSTCGGLGGAFGIAALNRVQKWQGWGLPWDFRRTSDSHSVPRSFCTDVWHVGVSVSRLPEAL